MPKCRRHPYITEMADSKVNSSGCRMAWVLLASRMLTAQWAECYRLSPCIRAALLISILNTSKNRMQQDANAA